MRPVRTAANRSKLFFRYFMDCQTPGKPGGGTTQTWDIAERAVRGIAELFSQHGLVRALGFCSEPEVAAQQAPLFRELAQQGFSQALHFQVRGYRAPGAKQDYDWQRDLSLYDYDEQKAVLTIAKDHWEQAMGMAAEDFGACCAQANDHTFPILAELGFRQSYCSVPGRYDPQAGHYWWGAFAHSHHTSAKSRLICGDLDLYEIPVTRDLQPIAGPRPRTWRTRDFRAESELGFEGPVLSSTGFA